MCPPAGSSRGGFFSCKGRVVAARNLAPAALLVGAACGEQKPSGRTEICGYSLCGQEAGEGGHAVDEAIAVGSQQPDEPKLGQVGGNQRFTEGRARIVKVSEVSKRNKHSRPARLEIGSPRLTFGKLSIKDTAGELEKGRRRSPRVHAPQRSDVSGRKHPTSVRKKAGEMTDDGAQRWLAADFGGFTQFTVLVSFATSNRSGKFFRRQP